MTARCILTPDHVLLWKSSPAYNDYCAFLRQLNDSARRCVELLDPNLVQEAALSQVVDLMNQLSLLVDEVQPLELDQTQRFGNKAFRIWFQRMSDVANHFFNDWPASDELCSYFTESFGNQQRIDYGTGHEMNFVIFLLGLYKLKLLPTSGPPTDRSRVLSLSRQLLNVFGRTYLPLVRKIQLRYNLEPAGSHGVFSLDDFQFLPFIWGSAQLIDHPDIVPANFHEKEQAATHADKFMFHAAVHFIHSVKKGPFFEHSNQLWNISAVESWSKINKGLMKMYSDEVLHKFPIVQHLLFGQHVLRWQNNTAKAGHERSSGLVKKVIQRFGNQKNGDPEEEIVNFEYHILYSWSYDVPVLYFKAVKQDGSYLEIEKIWGNIPASVWRPPDQHQEQQEASDRKEQRLTYQQFGDVITQMEHPWLALPFFHLHPCHTSQLLANVSSHVAPNHSRLLLWISSIAPLVHLQIDPRYALRLNSTTSSPDN